MSSAGRSNPPGAVLVFVGGGPRTVSLLERIAANAAVVHSPSPLHIHVVDPFPAGGGRIWRRKQSSLLWMNSVAKDVTMFTDESVTCEGPIVPGPTLDQWVVGEGRQVLIDSGLAEQADVFTANDFASREIQSLYLSWTFDRAVASLPDSIDVTTHRQRAVAVTDVPAPYAADADEDSTWVAQQQIELDNGTHIVADVVVLAQGYLDRRLTGVDESLLAAAAEQNLTYIPPGFTADIDLSGLRPGATVLVRGFGLAFIDLMVLVFEGRGGRFVGDGDELEYLPSGLEPVLHVGSRRGVPYHAKLGYSLGSSAPVAPFYFTPDVLAALAAAGRPLDFRATLWPLIVKELTAAHYRQLFEFHSERTLGSFTDISDALGRSEADSPEFRKVVEDVVPDPADRFDIRVIDRPLSGRKFADHNELSAALVDYTRGDLTRRSDPRYSSDHAVFDMLLTVYGVLAGAVVAGWVSAQDRVQYMEGEFHGLFSFLASGPPPRRLFEMLALHRAGFLHFAGPDLQVAVTDGRFIGTSAAVAGAVVADSLIDARLPRPDVRAASDPIISGLLAAGELAAVDLTASDGSSLGGGQLLADGGCHAVRADRSVHPTRFLLGPSVSGSAGSAGFSRPGFNGPGFRQNDNVARELLRLTASIDVSNRAEDRETPAAAGRLRALRPVPDRPVTPPPPTRHPVPAHPHLHQDRIENSHAS